MSEEGKPPDPVRSFANRGLITWGIVLILAGGLCTGGFIYSFYTSMPGEPGVALAFSQIALFIGAAPVIAGLILVAIGFRGGPR